MVKSRDTEVDAYVFIRDELKTLGWNIRNPARYPKGQVYTQNQCLSHPEIEKWLGQKRPENTVKLAETKFWVIEAKRSHRQIKQAIDEAEYYAKKINKSKIIKVPIISGVAGNEIDGYVIKSRFLIGNKFELITINEKEVSGLISPEIAKILLSTNNPDIKDIPVDEKLFLSKAEKINGILHIGAINKNQRAKVMAALLLSIIDETPPNIDASPPVLINDINGRVKSVLNKQGKPEFYEYIKLSLPATEDNHIKFKNALVSTIQELNNLNIRSAMNSGTDVLGKFYEVFLKYGNGAKEIGIVLTPRHITKFATEILNPTLQDIIYDPCCGTGGFLISCFDHVKPNANEKQINKFKQNNLFGVEQEPEVVALAIVNMIFRGDGKNNIVEGNCFQRYLVSSNGGIKYRYEKPREENYQTVTKVLMNPPFALKNSDEKEYKFVDYALTQIQDGGLLFSILPSSEMVRGGSYLGWRRKLLEKNTLLAVVTFPEDLFYPIGVHTIGVFIKKGIQHPKNQNVLWIRALNDGLLKSKGKRLPNPKAKNDLEEIKNMLQAFIMNPKMKIDNVPEFQKACPIDFKDKILELAPEAYLGQHIPSLEETEEDMEKTIRESVAFLIKSKKED
jgi:type I restriction-modification system DNA methylase subunit